MEILSADSSVWKTNNICYAAFGLGAYFDDLELIFIMLSLTPRLRGLRGS